MLKKSKNPAYAKEWIVNCIKNEVILWKSLDHPNIVKFYAFSETSNNIYLFLKYCNEKDIEKILKNKTKIKQKEAFNIFR